jgi:hypothetical protein
VEWEEVAVEEEVGERLRKGRRLRERKRRCSCRMDRSIDRERQMRFALAFAKPCFFVSDSSAQGDNGVRMMPSRRNESGL